MLNSPPNDSRSEQRVLARLERAGFRDGDRWPVRQVDVTVRAGEIVTLIGPNGSGKSTTARLLLGLLQPTEGSVWRAADIKIGYVPQKFTVDWTLPLSVKRLMTLTARHDPAEIEAALSRTGVAHLINDPLQTLSGGEFQRVLLARALIASPDLLVLDEPVQGVDFSGEIAMYDLIADLRDERDCGILLVSHDLHVVMAKTDTVVCLNGHVCCHGTPDAVATSTEYLQLFGDRAADTLAVYRHRHDHEHHGDEIVPHNHEHDHAHGGDHA